MTVTVSFRAATGRFALACGDALLFEPDSLEALASEVRRLTADDFTVDATERARARIAGLINAGTPAAVCDALEALC